MAEQLQESEPPRIGQNSFEQAEAAKRYLAREGRFRNPLCLRDFIALLDLGYELEDWQYEDMEDIISAVSWPTPEIVIIRSRNGSKTHDGILVCLYFSYLGYDVIFYVAEGTQMGQPKKYLSDIVKNTFIKYCLVDNKRILTKVFEISGSLEIRLLSYKKAKSPRSDVLFFDEEALMEKVDFLATLGQQKSSKIGLKIHASTPIKGSVFEENYLRLEKIGQVRVRTYENISFLNKKLVETDREYMPEWMFQQEYMCLFTAPHGAIFNNVIYTNPPDDIVFNEYKCAGLDWNPVEHHRLIAGRWSKDGKSFWVTDDVDISKGFNEHLNDGMLVRIRPFYSGHNRLCQEQGGANMGFTAWLKDLFGKDNTVTDKMLKEEPWDSAGKNKFEIIVKMMDKTIYIDGNSFSELAREVENAHWAEKVTETKVHKNKADSPHRFDAFLHACSDKLHKDWSMRSVKWK